MSDKTCGPCNRCEHDLLEGWARRLREIEPGDEPALEALATEIHEDRAKRHPWGIAEDLSMVIAELCLGDLDALARARTDLRELAERERRDADLNDEPWECPGSGEGS